MAQSKKIVLRTSGLTDRFVVGETVVDRTGVEVSATEAETIAKAAVASGVTLVVGDETQVEDASEKTGDQTPPDNKN